MNLLTAYLSKPKTRQVLSKQPGQAGFSLIELVVVIAVLAVLVAIALPNFLGVSDDASVRSAQQAVINALKECQAAKARGKTNTSTTGNTFGNVALTDFNVVPVANGANNLATGTPCFDSGSGIVSITATPKVGNKFPTFTISSQGDKTCTPGTLTAGTNDKTNTLGCRELTAAQAANAATGAAAVAATYGWE
jgi:prepilin-type N-terminal cleavage/methylation domain-containing protein